MTRAFTETFRGIETIPWSVPHKAASHDARTAVPSIYTYHIRLMQGRLSLIWPIEYPRITADEDQVLYTQINKGLTLTNQPDGGLFYSIIPVCQGKNR